MTKHERSSSLSSDSGSPKKQKIIKEVEPVKETAEAEVSATSKFFLLRNIFFYIYIHTLESNPNHSSFPTYYFTTTMIFII